MVADDLNSVRPVVSSQGNNDTPIGDENSGIANTTDGWRRTSSSGSVVKRRSSSIIRQASVTTIKNISSQQLLEASQQTTVIEETIEESDEPLPEISMHHIIQHNERRFSKQRRRSSMAVSLTPDVLNALVNNTPIIRRPSVSLNNASTQVTTQESEVTDLQATKPVEIMKRPYTTGSVKKAFVPLSRPKRPASTGTSNKEDTKKQTQEKKDDMPERQISTQVESQTEITETVKEVEMTSVSSKPEEDIDKIKTDVVVSKDRYAEKRRQVENDGLSPIPDVDLEFEEEVVQIAKLPQKTKAKKQAGKSRKRTKHLETEQDSPIEEEEPAKGSESIGESEAEEEKVTSGRQKRKKQGEEEEIPEPVKTSQPENLRRSARLRMMEKSSFNPIGNEALSKSNKLPRKRVYRDYSDSEDNDEEDGVLDEDGESFESPTKKPASKKGKYATQTKKAVQVRDRRSPVEKLQEKIGSCSVVNFKKRPTLESPHILEIPDTGRHDEKGRVVVVPSDLPTGLRNNCPIVFENGEAAVIDPQEFTIEDLCSKNFLIGERDEEYVKYEEAKLARRRKREQLHKRKIEARKQGYSVKEVEDIKREAEGDDGVSDNMDFDSLVEYKAKPAAPQLLMVDGTFILDSTEVDRHQLAESAFNGPDGDTRVREVVNKYDEFFNSATFSKHKRTEGWSKSETDLFYEGLSMFGTDFSILAGMFPGRTRRHIRNKFKYEEKNNSTKLELTLMRRLPVQIDAYASISGQTVRLLDDIKKEIQEIDAEYQKRSEIELENKELARLADSNRALEEDEAAFGISAVSKSREVRTYGRKTKAQLKKEIRKNEEVLGSIDMMEPE